MSAVQTIRFCEVCDNKFYHQVSDDSLIYFCRVCGNVDKSISHENVCVLNIQYDQKDNNKPFEHFVNKYTKHDPTLPHIILPCPNEKCSSNKENADKKTDVIYIRYDNHFMKHLYMCVTCDFIWKSNE